MNGIGHVLNGLAEQQEPSHSLENVTRRSTCSKSPMSLRLVGPDDPADLGFCNGLILPLDRRLHATPAAMIPTGHVLNTIASQHLGAATRALRLIKLSSTL